MHQYPKCLSDIFTKSLCTTFLCIVVEEAGGQCLPCIVDIRDEETIHSSVQETVKKCGGIDILINNASAISLTGTLETSMKRLHNILLLYLLVNIN